MSDEQSKSDVQRLLDELAPGEKREHLRSVEPTGAEGRFWLVAKIGEISPGSLRWTNDKPRPTDEGVSPVVTMEQIEQPIFEADIEESPIGDFYRIDDSLYLWRSTIVDCLRALDPKAAEYRRAETRGLESTYEFYLTLMRRRLDAIDVSKTNLILHNRKLVASGEIYRKTVYFPKGVCLREDIPADIHCFVEPYSGQLLFSIELLTCLRDARVHGIYARHPTTDETRVPEIRL